MGSRRAPPFPSLLLLLLSLLGCVAARDGLVMPVRHTFDGRRLPLSVLRANDARRHGRNLLGGVDVSITGLPKYTADGPGFYSTELLIGTPPVRYTFQIETTRSPMWLYCDPDPKDSSCADCTEIYESKNSHSHRKLSCRDQACEFFKGTSDPSCDDSGTCAFTLDYFDGTEITGNILTDYVEYDLVSGQHKIAKVNISFGCAHDNDGVDYVAGALGFGRLDISMISQLASAGITNKAFAHCLDTRHGGGIFAIGQLVEPKVNTTPLIPHREEYGLTLKSIEIYDEILDEERVALFDSGTILSYVPRKLYEQIISMVFKRHGYLRLHDINGDQCFRYIGSLDDDFPKVTLHFKMLSMDVLPHDYFYSLEPQEGIFCIGWQPTDLKDGDGSPLIIFGAMTLTNKLIFYDIENEVIGWTEHNCSHSIMLGDKGTNKTYIVESRIMSFASRWKESRFMILSLLLTAIVSYLNL